MIKSLKRFLGQDDETSMDQKSFLSFDPRVPPNVPQGALKITRHTPMNPSLSTLSLADGIALERVHSGETIAVVMSRIDRPLADATILDALMLARLTGKIWFPMQWQNRLIVFPGTVFHGPSWSKVVSFLNLVSSGATASMRGLRDIDTLLDDHAQIFVACAAEAPRAA